MTVLGGRTRGGGPPTAHSECCDASEKQLGCGNLHVTVVWVWEWERDLGVWAWAGICHTMHRIKAGALRRHVMVVLARVVAEY